MMRMRHGDTWYDFLWVLQGFYVQVRIYRQVSRRQTPTISMASLPW